MPPDDSGLALYPDIIPPLPGHPTRERFEVTETGDGRGFGLTAKVGFPAGAEVAKLAGILVHTTTLNTIQITPHIHLSDSWFCRYLLHGCDPNLAIDIETLVARAVKPIRPGDRLTIDYGATEDHLARPFPCHCGAATCREWITGRRENRTPPSS